MGLRSCVAEWERVLNFPENAKKILVFEYGVEEEGHQPRAFTILTEVVWIGRLEWQRLSRAERDVSIGDITEVSR